MGIMDSFDPARVIRAALGSGGDFAEVYVEDTLNTSIVLEEDKIEKVVSGRDRGVGVRVISGLKTYYAYTNDLSEAAILDVAGVVAKGVKEGVDMGDISLGSPRVAPGFDISKPTSGVGILDKVAIVEKANAVARAVDKRVVQVRVVYGDSSKRVAIANSLGEWVEEERSSIVFVCQVVSGADDVIQTGYEPVGGAMGFEVFDEFPPEEVAELAARRAVKMLGARRAPGGSMPVVLSSEAGGTMIHEAVGHGLEADLALSKLSVYSGKLGERVAAPIITVVDDATVPYKRGSGFYDDEGSPSERTVLVEKGILKAYMYDRLSAMKSGAKSTGNGRRESYQYRPIPRMTNTMILSGETDPEEIVASLDKGLLVKRMGGGQVNTVNGDFVFEVTEGYLIENGSVGEAVRGATLTGNGPEVLSAIDMVGTDLGFGIGTCGKDAQGVPVADAQPTLRIPEIVVGGGVGGGVAS
jgi:TldD protein